MSEWREHDTSLGENTTWDFTKNPVLEGEYLGKKDDVGHHHQTVYSVLVETPRGPEMKEFWGKAMIDRGMANVVVGELVRVTFVETKELENGNKLKVFKVESKEREEEFV